MIEQVFVKNLVNLGIGGRTLKVVLTHCVKRLALEQPYITIKELKVINTTIEGCDHDCIAVTLHLMLNRLF